MGWVLKSWRTEALAALVAEAQDRAGTILRDAEREARRRERHADREVADAAAQLEALECLAVEARARVQAERRRLRGAEPIRAARLRPPRRGARSRRDPAPLRDSPLAELFRATASR